MPKKSLLPFVILGSGFAWAALFSWLRRRRERLIQGGAAPVTHYLALIGVGGLLLCMIAAGVAAYLKWGQ